MSNNLSAYIKEMRRQFGQEVGPVPIKRKEE